MNEVVETFDFVIVGSGGGSMCAALVVRSAGKTALLLEKTALIGGTTARSGGVMWIPNNSLMAGDGVKDSLEKAMTYLDHLVGDHDDTPGATRERRRAYVTEGPRMIDFLLAQGITLHRYPYWPDYFDELPGGTDHGRAVVADLFDINELGPEKARLRPNYVPFPAKPEEVMQIPLLKTTLNAKLARLKIGLRILASKLTGKHYVTFGAALQGQMFQAALKSGVDVRTNAAVERLVVDETGRITAVVAKVDGKPRTFAARAGVLINAGGFARNQAMRDEYQPGSRAEWSNTTEGDTGEMILEMMRVGAAVAQMDASVGMQIAIPPEKPEILPMVQTDLAKPHSIVVDQTGTRYVREAQSYMSFCQAMFARHKSAPAVPSWAIFDSQYMAKYMVAASPPGSTKPQSWYESGFLKKANSLDELAKLCKMDPSKLVASITRFNELVHKGKDVDLQRGERAYDRFIGDSGHKPSATLGTVEKPPFYAYQVYPGDIGTFGGAVTDVHARVLRADGSVIPGLYATGTSTAAVMGRTYPGAGCSVGPSFVWGYVAAKHAMTADNAATSDIQRKPRMEPSAGIANRKLAVPGVR
jgi:3-oxosteroid 1-dehydrogenase